jgi:hypothetical protein
VGTKVASSSTDVVKLCTAHGCSLCTIVASSRTKVAFHVPKLFNRDESCFVAHQSCLFMYQNCLIWTKVAS